MLDLREDSEEQRQLIDTREDSSRSLTGRVLVLRKLNHFESRFERRLMKKKFSRIFAGTNSKEEAK